MVVSFMCVYVYVDFVALKKISFDPYNFHNFAYKQHHAYTNIYEYKTRDGCISSAILFDNDEKQKLKKINNYIIIRNFSIEIIFFKAFCRI